MAETYRIAITLTNEDKGYRFSDYDEDVPEWLIGDNGQPNFGALYRELQSEYGRCTSSVYVDVPNQKPKRIGWFFVSRQHYEDTNESYLRGAWVTVFTERPAERLSVSVD